VEFLSRPNCPIPFGSKEEEKRYIDGVPGIFALLVKYQVPVEQLTWEKDIEPVFVD